MSRLAELLEQRALLQREVRAVQRPLTRLQATSRKREQRRPLQTTRWPGSHREVQYSLCALEIADWTFQDALTLLDHVRSPPRWGVLDRASQERVIEDLSLKYDAAAVATWMDHGTAANQPRLKELWVIHSEWRTGAWAQAVNAEKGVAPSSLKICEKYRAFLANAPASLGLLNVPCDSLNAKRCWAAKWRRRWGARLGVLPVLDVDPVDVLQEKAARKDESFLLFLIFFLKFSSEKFPILGAP